MLKNDYVGSYKGRSELSDRRLSIDENSENEASFRKFNPAFNKSFDELPLNQNKEDTQKDDPSDSDVVAFYSDDEIELPRKTSYNFSLKANKLLYSGKLNPSKC